MICENYEKYNRPVIVTGDFNAERFYDMMDYTRESYQKGFDEVTTVDNMKFEKISYEQLVKLMVENDLKLLEEQRKIYEKGINKVDNIIGEIILAYVKTYVMYIEDDEGLAKNNYKSVYIYNVKQTENLTKYPFNSIGYKAFLKQ